MCLHFIWFDSRTQKRLYDDGLRCETSYFYFAFPPPLPFLLPCRFFAALSPPSSSFIIVSSLPFIPFLFTPLPRSGPRPLPPLSLFPSFPSPSGPRPLLPLPLFPSLPSPSFPALSTPSAKFSFSFFYPIWRWQQCCKFLPTVHYSLYFICVHVGLYIYLQEKETYKYVFLYKEWKIFRFVLPDHLLPELPSVIWLLPLHFILWSVTESVCRGRGQVQ